MAEQESIFDKVERLLDFQSEDEVYVALVLARKKYNKEGKKSSRVVNREVLTKDNWPTKVQRCLTMMKHFDDPVEVWSPADCNFYLQVNPRSTRRALRNFKQVMADMEYDNRVDFFQHFESRWVSCLEKSSARSRRKTFIIDVDDKLILEDVIAVLPVDKWNEYHEIVETRNGYHILMPPFNVQKFKEELRVMSYDTLVEVKTDDCVFIARGDQL